MADEEPIKPASAEAVLRRLAELRNARDVADRNRAIEKAQTHDIGPDDYERYRNNRKTSKAGSMLDSLQSVIASYPAHMQRNKDTGVNVDVIMAHLAGRPTPTKKEISTPEQHKAESKPISTTDVTREVQRVYRSGASDGLEDDVRSETTSQKLGGDNSSAQIRPTTSSPKAKQSQPSLEKESPRKGGEDTQTVKFTDLDHPRSIHDETVKPKPYQFAPLSSPEDRERIRQEVHQEFHGRDRSEDRPQSGHMHSQIVGEALKQTWKTFSPKSYTRVSQAADVAGYVRDIAESGMVGEKAQTIARSVTSRMGGGFGGGGLGGIGGGAAAGGEGGAMAGGLARSAATAGTALLPIALPLLAVAAVAAVGKVMLDANKASFNRQSPFADGNGPEFTTITRNREMIMNNSRFRRLIDTESGGSVSLDHLMAERTKTDIGVAISSERRTGAWDRFVMRTTSPLYDFTSGVQHGVNKWFEGTFDSMNRAFNDHFIPEASRDIANIVGSLPKPIADFLFDIRKAVVDMANAAKETAEKEARAHRDASRNLDSVFYSTPDTKKITGRKLSVPPRPHQKKKK